MSTIDRTAIAGPKPRMLTRRGVIKGGLGLAGVAGLVLPAAGARAAMEAANGLVITDYRLSPPAWPKGQRLTVTVVADLHAGGPNMGLDRVRQVVDAANELRSNLTVVLGDFFATHHFVTERVPHPVWAAELSRLHAPLGVYTILGNHDWWYDIDGVRRALDTVTCLSWKTKQFCWVLRAAGSGWQALATRSPIGLARARLRASTICREPWHASAPTIRLSCSRMSPIFSPRCRRAWRSPSLDTPMADRFGSQSSAGLGTVGLWGTLCLRAHRGERPPWSCRGPRLQQGAAALGVPPEIVRIELG